MRTATSTLLPARTSSNGTACSTNQCSPFELFAYGTTTYCPSCQTRICCTAALRDSLPQPGFASSAFNAANGFNIDISEWKSSSAASLFMSDLSSLTLHEPTGHLLLLSDESALVVEYAPDGQPIGMLPLWRGFNGLQRKVPQPEGLAVGPDNAIYVLSEPNLFYRFESTQNPSASR